MTIISDAAGKIRRFITEAPVDGQKHARKDGGWSVVSGGSGFDFIKPVRG